MDLAIKQHIETNSDYTTCHDLPKGTEGEIISSEAIKKVFFLAEDSSYSEYMTYYFTQNSLFRKSNLEIKKKYQKNWNLTIDYKHQFNKVKKILNFVYNKKKPYTIDDLIKMSKNEPYLFKETAKMKNEKKININTSIDLSKLKPKMR